MLKKGRLIWLTVVLLLALAQPGLPALTAVGPVVPDADGSPLTPPWAPPFQLGAPTGYNGFPVWYRDSLGQTVILAPQDPLTIWDAVIPGNAFSAQVQFGGEAMYWMGTATIPVANDPASGKPGFGRFGYGLGGRLCHRRCHRRSANRLCPDPDPHRHPRRGNLHRVSSLRHQDVLGRPGGNKGDQ